MIPTLPDQDPDPVSRRAQLTRARETWRFLKRYSMGSFPGIGLAAAVPVSDRFSPNYGLEVGRVGGAALLNHLLLSVTGRFAGNVRKPSAQDWLDVARARHRPESGLW
ncbi:MAG TPA: hypothetical protein VFQ61_07195, partial [Polyangiaceae bacterium]|nr:hypothetical protein [Polyangiaceae bacterium]